MPLLDLIRRVTEYAVGAALVLGHLALAGRRVALVELLEPPGVLPHAALPRRTSDGDGDGGVERLRRASN